MCCTAFLDIIYGTLKLFYPTYLGGCPMYRTTMTPPHHPTPHHPPPHHPQVEVLNEGEYVNDLFVVVSGELEKYSSTLPFMTEDISLNTENASVHGTGLFGTSQVLGEGDVLGEIAFITGTAQLEVWRCLCCHSRHSKSCTAVPENNTFFGRSPTAPL